MFYFTKILQIKTTLQCLFLILVFLLYPDQILAKCSRQLLEQESNLVNIYTHLRKEGKKCKYPSAIYLAYANRAFLAGRMAESYWAARMAAHESKSKNTEEWAAIQLAQSRALLGMKRVEEAITSLKPLATANVIEEGKLAELQQKSHLLLIRAYYTRANYQKDRNVKFLIARFKARYPNSKYSSFLQEWESQ